jgi:hypothetical protein
MFWKVVQVPCKSQNKKRPELRFRAVLGGGTSEVRFERVTPNSPHLRSDRPNADDSQLKDEMATQVGSALVKPRDQPEECTRKRLGVLSEALW